MDKRVTEQEFIDELSSGMTIGIGGWGSRRKPMSMIRAILRSSLADLTIVCFGGPDVGLLCAAGKVRRVISPFVAPDSMTPPFPSEPVLEPHYRRARQLGLIEDEPYDEGLFFLSLQAAAWRIPFLPSRAGLGSDLDRDNPRLKMVTSPYDDRETLIAAPALSLDAALIHMNRGDQAGNGQYLGPDLYFDDLFLAAAQKGFMSVEQIIETSEFLKEGPVQSLRVNRMNISGVLEAPGGAHFTSCEPDYDRDELIQRDYIASAKSPEAWAMFRSAWLDLSEKEYQIKRRSLK